MEVTLFPRAAQGVGDMTMSVYDTDGDGIVDAAETATVPDASAVVKGIVELATPAEVITGTDTVRAVTPEGFAGGVAAYTRRVYGAKIGGTDTYTLTTSPALTAYTDGLMLLVAFTNVNTGAATLNVDGLGAIDLVKDGGSALLANDIRANLYYWVLYDGTDFHIQNKYLADTYTISVCTGLIPTVTDAATTYWGNLPTNVGAVTERKIVIRKKGLLMVAEILCRAISVVGTNENWSLYIRVNNTTDYLIATVGAATAGRVFSNTAMNGGAGILLVAGDYIEIKMVNPTWATNPTNIVFGGNLYLNY